MSNHKVKSHAIAEFHALMRARRAKMDITQVELASRAGLAKETIEALEAEKYEPKLTTFLAVLKALGVKTVRVSDFLAAQ